MFSYLWVKMQNTVEWKSTIYKKWHYILKLPETRFLFSLLKDPKETENHYNAAGETAGLLEKRFEDFMKKSKKFKQESSKIKLDKKHTDNLKTLGYVK